MYIYTYNYIYIDLYTFLCVWGTVTLQAWDAKGLKKDSISVAASLTYRNNKLLLKSLGGETQMGEKTTFKNMRKHGKLGEIMEDNERNIRNMTTWQGT